MPYDCTHIKLCELTQTFSKTYVSKHMHSGTEWKQEQTRKDTSNILN